MRPVEIGGHVDYGPVAGLERGGRRDRLQRAQDSERPPSQRPTLVARDGEQISDYLDRYFRREILDEIDLFAPGHSVEQAAYKRFEIGREISDGARGERPGDEFSYAPMQGGIVEDEARRVVLVERAVPVFGSELLALVG